MLVKICFTLKKTSFLLDMAHRLFACIFLEEIFRILSYAVVSDTLRFIINTLLLQ